MRPTVCAPEYALHALARLSLLRPFRLDRSLLWRGVFSNACNASSTERGASESFVPGVSPAVPPDEAVHGHASSRVRQARHRTVALVFGFVVVEAWTSASARTKNADAQIKQDIIGASIAAYSGSCPCPYNTDRRGHRCGARSAYSRPGGAMPLCYERDVTQQMVDDYRKRTSS